MKKFRFRNFQVYKDARKFVIETKEIIESNFPKKEIYSLTSQTRRALDSIILNIAEGSDRSTDKDFALFLNRSHTSLNEVVACFDIALDCSYINGADHEVTLKRCGHIANQLTAFRKSLLNDPSK